MANSGRRRAGALAPDERRDSGRSGSQGGKQNRGVSRRLDSVNPVDEQPIRVRKPKRVWNQGQLEAINHTTGPVVVNSTCGSGKTAVVIARIAKLIRDDGVDPRSILATTFTKKAADEMNARLKETGVDTDEMSVQTMHSFCFRLLKKNGFENWEVDDVDQLNIIIKSVTGFKGMQWRGCDITLVEQFISLAKNSLIRPEDASSWQTYRDDPFFGDMRYVEAYTNVEGVRKQKKLLTFDDMLIDGVELLQKNERVRSQVQEKYEYVIIDEFQDSNMAQIRLMEIVSEPRWNLMVVGDSDQAIYKWRGALPEYMVEFAERYNAKSISMGINYRCPKNVVDRATKCILNNQLRVAHSISAHKETDGIITCRGASDQDEEANLVADEIERLSNEGVKWGDHHCYFRTNAQSRALEEVFSKRKFPYVVIGGGSFYQRKEVQDLLSYMRLIVNPRDCDSGKRALSRPFRYVAMNVIENIERIEAKEKCGYVEACRINNARFNNRGVSDFYYLMTELLEKIETDLKNGYKNTVGELISWIVRRTNFIDYLTQNEGSDTLENSRAANVGELIRSADRYYDIEEFLRFVNWQIQQRKKKQQNENKDVIQCMSLHRCVHPDTIVETNNGFVPISSIETEGQIGTTSGMRTYTDKFSYTDRELLTITTKNGYSITVTTDHKLMSYKDSSIFRSEFYRPTLASELQEGDFLRLQLGRCKEPEYVTLTHQVVNPDVRAAKYKTPTIVTEDFAEFLGLMVADGTIYKNGFRLCKQHKDVCDRFASLVVRLFGITAHEFLKEGIPAVEVSSTYLSAWLLGIDGLAPNNKDIPSCIMQSPSSVQASFMRGLFEDGTANYRKEGDYTDHVSLTTVYPNIAKKTQLLLLAQNIISTRAKYHSWEEHSTWRVSIFGKHVATFQKQIGFVSAWKNSRIKPRKSNQDCWNIIPVGVKQLNYIKAVHTKKGDYSNARIKGHISREIAEKYGMTDLLKFHHDRIVSIVRHIGPAMCVEVPNHGRFIQDGFDGCNSKGLEIRSVFIIGANEGILPHANAKEPYEEERRLFYVGMTRAQEYLHISYVEQLGMKGKLLSKSRFIDEAELMLSTGLTNPAEETNGI